MEWYSLSIQELGNSCLCSSCVRPSKGTLDRTLVASAALLLLGVLGLPDTLASYSDPFLPASP